MKYLFSFLVIFLFGLTAIQAQNPIPSYNFLVYKQANFQEKSLPARAKKKVNVAVTCTSGKSAICMATVWIYSLDLQTVYGPYTVYGGETLSVDVDGGEWGAYVTTDDQIVVDVWIE
jgi:hypothetical protein